MKRKKMKMSKIVRIEEEEGQLYKVEMVETKEPITRELVENQYKILSEQYLINEEEIDALFDKQSDLADKMFLLEKFVPESMKVVLSEEYLNTEEEGEMLIDKSIIEEHLPEEVNVELDNNENQEE